MSSRKITIAPDGNIVVIKGYKAADVARSAGLRPTYSGSTGGWVIDLRRLPELVAWLEYRNIRHEVVGDHVARPVVDESDGDDVHRGEELDLFGQVVA